MSISKFARVMDIVRGYSGLKGFGYKLAARFTKTTPTTMRYALQAYPVQFLCAAIDAGTIADPRVIGTLHKFPVLAQRIVCELETRLGRKLTRSRCESLAEAYAKVISKPAGPIRSELISSANHSVFSGLPLSRPGRSIVVTLH
jgi:hypothetical protein